MSEPGAELGQNKSLKAALRESNAIGWLAFALLVTAIGVGTIIFGQAPPKVADSGPANSQTTR